MVEWKGKGEGLGGEGKRGAWRQSRRGKRNAEV